MNFLAPLFLFGALAVAGPILFHLIRRTTRESTSFSSLMFLEPSPPRITRRSRLENLWLLLLRCLILGLLAVAFARPFLKSGAASDAPPAADGKRIAILLDISASMRREGLWQQARQKAETLVQGAGPADQVAVLAFDDRVHLVLDFAEWRQTLPGNRVTAVTSRLATLSPGWAGTRLDTALTSAAELFLEPGEEHARPGEIVVVSDLQEGARLDGLQAYEWPHGIHVTLARLQPTQPGNASLQWLSDAEEINKPAAAPTLRVRVSNSPDAKREQFQAQWRGQDPPAPDAAKIEVYSPAGQSRVLKLPPPTAADTSLVLTGDGVDFDNTLYILPPQPLKLPLLFVGADAPDDSHGSLYYLRRAFPKTRHQEVEFLTPTVAEAVPAFQLQQAQLAVLGDGASDAAVDSLREFAQAGKIVIAPLASASAGNNVARLLGIAHVSVSEAEVKDYALLSQIDFQHPLFASFADPRFSDFTKIHFWKFRRLDASEFAGARVLARFDSGDPAIIQAPLGKGSVVIFASSWRPSDSQLALSSKFVPLLQTLLDQSSNLPAQKAQYFIGDEVPLGSGAQPLTVTKPDGAQVVVEPGRPFADATLPGIYSVSPDAHRFVVNLSPEESRTAPLPSERLAGLGVPLSEDLPAAPDSRALLQAQAVNLENRQKLWRILVVAALIALLLETTVATLLARPRVAPLQT